MTFNDNDIPDDASLKIIIKECDETLSKESKLILIYKFTNNIIMNIAHDIKTQYSDAEAASFLTSITARLIDIMLSLSLQCDIVLQGISADIKANYNKHVTIIWDKDKDAKCRN